METPPPAPDDLPPTPFLAALLATDDTGPFLDDYWPERLYRVHGPFERIKDFLYEDLREILNFRCNHVRAFFHSVDGKPGQLTPTPQQFLGLYDAGFTLYFHGLRTPRTDAMATAINQELGLVPGGTRISAFASRRGQGLAPHYDFNDNLVIQAKGAKRWKIAPNRHVKWPSKPFTLGGNPGPIQLAEAPDGFPSSVDEIADWETVETRPGSVMYLPRGYWHYTETTEEESLHFNIQTGLTTWRDLASFFLLERAPIGNEAMREAIWNLFEDGVLRPEYRQALKAQISELVATITDQELAIPEADFDAYLARLRGSNA